MTMENEIRDDEIFNSNPEGEKSAEQPVQVEETAVPQVQETPVQQVQDVAPQVQEAPVQQAEAPVQQAPQIPNEEIAKLINSWFLNVRNTVKVVKEKDANLYKLNNELQAYRNDYSRQLFKSLAQNLINFREDCAKSLRDADEYALQKDAVIKYIGYVAADYETLLENLGIEAGEASIRFNGTEISSEPAKIKLFPIPEGEKCEEVAPALSFDEPLTQQMVIEFLDRKLEEIKAIMRKNEELDRVVGEFIKQSLLIERNEHQIVLYPVIRKLVNYHKHLKDDIADTLANTDAEVSVLMVAYKDILGRVINELEDVLNLCQVTVENALAEGDVYDPKRHRIMKFIPITAEQSEDNGKIVKAYTDLYKMDDKVFYPAKVDVYKVR